MSKNDGGPAFPLDIQGLGNSVGMTLRDYFASQVIIGYLSGNLRRADNMDKNGTIGDDEIAQTAYGLADAMLKERSKP